MIPPNTTNKFKDITSRWRTMSLFFEYRRGEIPLYSLSPEEKKLEVDGKILTFPSLHKIYLGYNHVPGYEYDFANEWLGGWAHWQLMLKNKLINPYFAVWREEMEIKLQASGFYSMINMSKDPKGFAAAKYLADRGWKGMRGRPSTEEIESTKKAMALATSAVEDDMQRMGLSLVVNK